MSEIEKAIAETMEKLNRISFRDLVKELEWAVAFRRTAEKRLIDAEPVPDAVVEGGK